MSQSQKPEMNKETKQYLPSEIEANWQRAWDEAGTYQPNLDQPGENHFYNLMMFPYPSAEGLHVGNMYAFTGADVYGRFKRQQGHSVFEPIGLDGFGIHSENYALKVGSHPMEQVEISEKNYYRQLRAIGNSYDWRHTVETYKPDYYRWTQWVFTELFKAGLAYRSSAEVNWCPSCKTVLADEQVIDGKCERCSSEVEKRSLEQWFFRITGYSERLLQDLSKIDWTEKVKTSQKNWIGKSEGAKVKFRILNSEFKIQELEVFTTRPDTLHGATFMVVAPEHPIVDEILRDIPSGTSSNDKEIYAVQSYVKQAGAKSDRERTEEGKEKTGVFSGVYALNPVNSQQIPIWIADYVLASYGTGAIMAVPAHDQRDYDFAKKYDLPIIEVVSGGDVAKEAYKGIGSLVNSGDWDGWIVPEAKGKAIAWLKEHAVGDKEITYHLRDWLISRQRYWGAPIPMIFCQTCADNGESWFTQNRHSGKRSASGIFSEGQFTRDSGLGQNDDWESAGWYIEDNLPVLLPHIDDYRPVGTGKAPLANHPEFYETTCPSCGGPARRETDVADTFLDSSWYFLRYPATDLGSIPFPMPEDQATSVIASEAKQSATDKNSKEIGDLTFDIGHSVRRTAWLPVDQYTGGAEHSVLHLLYARFMYKVLSDLGYVNVDKKNDEPFPKFFAHGLIIKEGAKMSKSKGNVVVPDMYIKKYGADTLRTYLMFLGPFSEGGDFQDAGIDGIHRFLKRVWKLLTTKEISHDEVDASAKTAMHQAIKGVTEDMAMMRYNTAIAKIMTWYNTLSVRESITSEEREVFLKLLAPFAPHMTEELYQSSSEGQIANGEEGNQSASDTFHSIHTSPWPVFDEAVIVDHTITIAIQVNGKLRDTIIVDREVSQNQTEIERLAKESANTAKFIEGKEIRKVIYVPEKILNIVV